MFWRLVHESLWRPRNRRRALWAVLAVALGTAVAAAMLNVSLDVGDKVGGELSSLGANIVITPAADSLPVEIGGIDYRPVSEGAYIPESSLGKLKEIYWRNNLIAFAPFLYVPVRVISPSGRDFAGREQKTMLVGAWFDRPIVTSTGERFQTGIRPLNPTWKLEGEWIDDSGPQTAGQDAMLGRSLAEALGVRLGDTITVANSEPALLSQGGPTNRRSSGPQAVGGPAAESNEKTQSFRVKGLVTTGGAEDRQMFASLALAQSLAGLPGKVRKAQVSALIKPDDEFSRRDPKTMTPEEYDRWYCSPYISSILHQIGEALPGAQARAIRPVAETQGNVLGKLTFLMGMLALLALVAAALSISSLASLAVVERRQEIGLMKAVGANDWLLSSLFLAEAAWQGIAGGTLGFVAGQFLARLFGRVVFDSEVAINWLLFPVMLLVALGVSFAGTWVPLRRAMQYQPAAVLRGE